MRSVNALSAAVLFCAAAVLTGCGATQKMSPPTSGAPTATLVFSQGPAIPEVVGNYLSVLTRADCIADSGWGAVSPLDMFRKSRTVRVEAGRRLYFHFMSLRAVPEPGGPTRFLHTTCQNVVSFVPEAHRAYALEQATPRASECHAAVRDSATGEAPATFEILPLSVECRQYGDSVFVDGVS